MLCKPWRPLSVIIFNLAAPLSLSCSCVFSLTGWERKGSHSQASVGSHGWVRRTERHVLNLTSNIYLKASVVIGLNTETLDSKNSH